MTDSGKEVDIDYDKLNDFNLLVFERAVGL